jgi:hypothetical protein
MKHASWAIALCLMAGGMMAQSAYAQQSAQQPAPQYALPAGSVGTMSSNEPTSRYSGFVKDPTPEQVRATWDLDNPNKSTYNRYAQTPSPAQVQAAWGKPGDPQKSDYNPYLRK